MAKTHLGILIKKNKLNTFYCKLFLLLNKKVDKLKLCLKTAASLFPFSLMTFLIARPLAFGLWPQTKTFL